MKPFKGLQKHLKTEPADAFQGPLLGHSRALYGASIAF